MKTGGLKFRAHARAEVNISAPNMTGGSEGTTGVLSVSMAGRDKVKTLVENEPRRCKEKKVWALNSGAPQKRC